MRVRQNIIAGGPLRRLSLEEQRQLTRKLHRELTAKYADEIARSSLFGRIAIWFRIQREILAKIEPHRSPHALYQTRAQK